MSERRDDGDAVSNEGGPASDGEKQGSFLNDFLSSILAVVGIGLLLFAISGVWPPLVAIESGSMAPNIHKGDLVFVMEEERFPSDHQFRDTGVATVHGSDRSGFRKFSKPGDVIVYEPDGNSNDVPVIHRAMFWVNESENWYQTKADPEYLPEDVDSCSDLTYCRPDHAGFITLGDNNQQYDQVQDPRAVSGPVRPEWIIGTAEFKMPLLGEFRLSVA